MHRFRPSLSYANVMSTVAVFAALGGGAYAAVSSIPGPGGVIHGCYQKKNGTLRLVPAGKKCAKSEKAIAFNQKGVPGRPGLPGAAGVPGAAGTAGANGEQGPQGPGATTFTKTVEPGREGILATLGNGVRVKAICGIISAVVLELETTDANNTFQGSGIAVDALGEPKPVSLNGGGKGFSSNGVAHADIEAIARDSAVGKFARIDVHGEYGSPCTFWGMVTPSS